MIINHCARLPDKAEEGASFRTLLCQNSVAVFVRDRAPFPPPSTHPALQPPTPPLFCNQPQAVSKWDFFRFFFPPCSPSPLSLSLSRVRRMPKNSSSINHDSGKKKMTGFFERRQRNGEVEERGHEEKRRERSPPGSLTRRNNCPIYGTNNCTCTYFCLRSLSTGQPFNVKYM